MMDSIPALAEALALVPSFAGISPGKLEPLPTTGLAHDHIRISGTGRLLRVPRQSQMRLDAARNLDYQAACFGRASAGGHAPRYFGQIRPCPGLPMGALIVEEIIGAPVKLPEGLPEVARALASIHALPVPPAAERAPLADPGDAYAATLEEVRDHARHLDAAALEQDARRMIEAEIDAAARHAGAMEDAPPTTLISFDAHPGNFLMDEANGRAVLVDLEKARYGAAGFDLAHATLYTSTTWDVATFSDPGHEAIARFHTRYLDALPGDLADAQRPHLMALRRLMWLWSITWCAKWRVASANARRGDKHLAEDTEDWSAENSADDLVEHVRGRVDHYLTPEVIERVRADWRSVNPLSDLLGIL
ncbi:aminoglycoside phosphotransferase family protein [Marivibrio halodurans]|uniref:Aminoglycoside phosphotransferase family protein n=1 Tax=Marivibrio halodurans TaxID=2039722 RepID=A0A8J7V3Y0_9PROT|nr:aminoglycoside phosphotransferase family protein [Marivibrio halodurans]MBP5858855.1 aminoglycoside phosphotransferase family protein [Marivibrio halodurans]